MLVTKNISKFIENQFPAFYKEYGPDFIAFMEAYYEFLELESNATSLTRNMFETSDIDLTMNQFIQHFREKYLAELPTMAATETRFIVKHILDLYRSKGSEKSIKLLFRLIFNEDIEIYTPKIDIFKPSASKWMKPSYIECAPTESLMALVGKMITGSLSGATAFIEGVVRKKTKGKVIDVAYLSNIVGDFRFNDVIGYDGNFENNIRVVGSLSSIDVTLGGSGYQIGDVFEVESQQGKHGLARVTGIENGTGRVQFELLDGGFGFTVTREIDGSISDFASDIYVSDVVLSIENEDTDFELFEKVIQQKEVISLFSALSISTEEIVAGDELVGYDSGSNIVARGKIYSLTNYDSLDEVVTTPQANVSIITLMTDGTFTSQSKIELVNPPDGIEIGSRVHEESVVDLAIDVDVDDFVVGNVVEQVITQTIEGVPYVLSITRGVVSAWDGSAMTVEEVFGSFVVGEEITNLTTGVGTGEITDIDVVDAGASADVSAIDVMAQEITVWNIIGVFTDGKKIRAIPSLVENEIVTATDSGAVTARLNEVISSNGIIETIEDISSRGIVVGQNSGLVGIYGDNDFLPLSATPTQLLTSADDMTTGDWTKTAMTVENIPLQGINRLTTTAGTENYVAQPIAWEADKFYRLAIHFNSTSLDYAFVRFPSNFRNDIGASSGLVIRVNLNTGNYQIYGTGHEIESIQVKPMGSVGYMLDITLKSFVAITTNLRFGANINDIMPPLTVGSRLDLISVTLHEKIDLHFSNIITLRPDVGPADIVKPFFAVSTGGGANFEIGFIENQEIITVANDQVGGTNLFDVPYLSIGIDGSGSGMGTIVSFDIVDGGTLYSNGSIVTFTGGGYGGAEPLMAAEGTITTDGGGIITSISLTTSGAGYFEEPTLVLPATAGTIADVDFEMGFGYGFPKDPSIGFDDLIIEALDSVTMTIGTIASLTNINPGSNYNTPPFVAVKNDVVNSFGKRGYIIELAPGHGAFISNEFVEQDYIDPENPLVTLTAKGKVKQLVGNLLYVRRLTFINDFQPSGTIVGQTSNTSATIVGLSEDSDSRPTGSNAEISSNVVTANGIVTEVEVISSGYGYENNEQVLLVANNNSTVATGNALVQTHGVGVGYWQTSESHASHTAVIQDSDFYQSYSYQIQSSIAIDRYRAMVEDLVHVAGNKMFGAIVMKMVAPNYMEAEDATITMETIT